MSERELRHRLNADDASVYEHLFAEYYDWLCHYVYQLSHDAMLAEDIVQETFIRLWERRGKTHITTSLKGYLFRSCHNQFLQYLKREKIPLSTLDQIRWDVLAESYAAEAEDDTHRHADRLDQLIDRLPPRCREIFVKHKLEQRKYREIARELGISVKTVEAQMAKALHFLREHAHLFFL